MKRLVTVALLLFVGAASHAQDIEIPLVVDTTIGIPGVFDIGGAGARARGMGSAYIAAGDDAAAVTFNPAGLYSIDKTSMTFGFDQFVARGNVSFSNIYVPQKGSFGGIGFFSIVSPFRIKGHGFVGALSYGRTSDEAYNSAVDVGFLIDPDGPSPQYDTVLYQVSIRQRYHAEFHPITFGFGTRLSEKVAAGLSLAIITGRSVDDLAQRNIADGWFVAEKFPQPVQYDFYGGLIDTSKFSAVTFSAGFKYTSDKTLLGAVLKLPYTLRQTTGRTLRATTFVNGQEYLNGSGVIFRDNNVIDIEIPMFIGVGAAYKPDTNTTFAADFEYRPFSGKEVNIRDSVRLVPGAKDQEFFRTADPGWRNVLIIRTGAEKFFETNSTMFPRVPLRAGIGFMPIPSPNYTNGVPSGTATALNLSLGSGVWWSLLHLDVAYTFRSLKQTYEDQYGATEINGKSHLLYVTFTGYF